MLTLKRKKTLAKSIKLAPALLGAKVLSYEKSQTDGKIYYFIEILPALPQMSPDISFKLTERSYKVKRSFEDFKFFHALLLEKLEKEYGQPLSRSEIASRIPSLPKKRLFLSPAVYEERFSQLSEYVKDLFLLPKRVTKALLYNEFFGLWQEDYQIQENKRLYKVMSTFISTQKATTFNLPEISLDEEWLRPIADIRLSRFTLSRPIDVNPLLIEKESSRANNDAKSKYAARQSVVSVKTNLTGRYQNALDIYAEYQNLDGDSVISIDENEAVPRPSAESVLVRESARRFVEAILSNGNESISDKNSSDVSQFQYDTNAPPVPALPAHYSRAVEKNTTASLKFYNSVPETEIVLNTSEFSDPERKQTSHNVLNKTSSFLKSSFGSTSRTATSRRYDISSPIQTSSLSTLNRNDYHPEDLAYLGQPSSRGSPHGTLTSGGTTMRRHSHASSMFSVSDDGKEVPEADTTFQSYFDRRADPPIVHVPRTSSLNRPRRPPFSNSPEPMSAPITRNSQNLTLGPHPLRRNLSTGVLDAGFPKTKVREAPEDTISPNQTHASQHLASQNSHVNQQSSTSHFSPERFKSLHTKPKSADELSSSSRKDPILTNVGTDIIRRAVELFTPAPSTLSKKDSVVPPWRAEVDPIFEDDDDKEVWQDRHRRRRSIEVVMKSPDRQSILDPWEADMERQREYHLKQNRRKSGVLAVAAIGGQASFVHGNRSGSSNRKSVYSVAPDERGYQDYVDDSRRRSKLYTRAHTLVSPSNRKEVESRFLQFKCIVDNDHTFMMMVSRNITFASILEKIAKKFGQLAFSSMRERQRLKIETIEFKDSDGHMVRICDEEDWGICLAETIDVMKMTLYVTSNSMEDDYNYPSPEPSPPPVIAKQLPVHPYHQKQVLPLPQIPLVDPHVIKSKSSTSKLLSSLRLKKPTFLSAEKGPSSAPLFSHATISSSTPTRSVSPLAEQRNYNGSLKTRPLPATPRGPRPLERKRIPDFNNRNGWNSDNQINQTSYESEPPMRHNSERTPVYRRRPPDADTHSFLLNRVQTSPSERRNPMLRRYSDDDRDVPAFIIEKEQKAIADFQERIIRDSTVMRPTSDQITSVGSEAWDY